MSLFNKLIKKSTQMTGNLLGNQATSNVQKGTDQLVDGMDLFRKAAEQKRNIPFEQVKGNLFEYIEAAKFNRNAGMSGSSTRAYVTEALGKPHDAADIILGNDGKVLTRVQAKFSSSANAA
ncbi:MAG: hypothetical protein IJ803_07960, partial [Oribacterium sp.]|nr:hypothetical protein [Oribacterium sp.]